MTHRGKKLAVKLIAMTLAGCAAEPYETPDHNVGWREVGARQREAEIAMEARGVWDVPKVTGDPDGPTGYRTLKAQRSEADLGAYRKTYGAWYEFYISRGYTPAEAHLMAGRMARP